MTRRCLRVSALVTKSSSGLLSSLLSGEGLIAEFKGKGKLYLQTRNSNEYGFRIGPALPSRV